MTSLFSPCIIVNLCQGARVKPRVKKLTKAEKYLKNLPIPNQNPDDLGNIGRHIENVMKSLGYDVDQRAVVDMGNIGVEIKTRKISSTSPHTIGKMCVEDIINTPWDRSPLKAKIQCQFRVEYDDVQNIVTEARVWDFDVHEIQSALKVSYESARKIFTKRKLDPSCTYVRGKDLGVLSDAYFENTTDTAHWDFRISHETMERYKKIINGQKHHKKLFEYA